MACRARTGSDHHRPVRPLGRRPINRVRSGDGASIVFGKRCSLHVMVQPGIAQRSCRRAATGSGLLVPPVGFRPRRQLALVSSAHPCQVHRAALRGTPLGIRRSSTGEAPLREGTRNELEPRGLHFSREAGKHWLAFADQSSSCGPGGGSTLLSDWPTSCRNMRRVSRRFWNVQRISRRQEISWTRCSGLSCWPTITPTRRFGCLVPACSHRKLRKSEKVRLWLLNHWASPSSSSGISSSIGPNSIREKKEIEQAIVLEAHGWLIPRRVAPLSGAKEHAKAWTIVRPGETHERRAKIGH